jgi:hypothetical protein
MPLEWKGEALLAKVRKAEQAGLLEHDEAVASGARDRALVASGTWRDSIRVITPPTATGHGFMSEVGSDSIAYGAIQELGPADGRAYRYRPAIRPAADAEGSKLSGRIAGHM